MPIGLTIGQLAKSVGINVQTVRYYERRRLLIPTDRKPSGYRLYGDEAVRRLRFIKNAQSLGFTLREIAELLSLQVRSPARCGDVRQRASAKLEQVEAKVRDLQALRKVLRGLIVACQARQPTEGCPIPQTLEKNERRRSNGNRKTTC